MKLIKYRWELWPGKKRKFVIAFHFVGWLSFIQLGIHIDFAMMNCELHLPCFFIHIGKESYHDVCIGTGQAKG